MKLKTVRIIQKGDLEWTATDAAILKGIAQGKTSRCIGSEINKSFRTVEKYINDMVFILDCENRTALVVKAIALGVIKNPYSIKDIPVKKICNYENF